MWWILEKALCNGVLEAFQVLVNLSLVVEKHFCSRL
jgi:hypothetical protein